MNDTIQPGIYEHYKGHQYRVLGVAQHSETLEKMVVYETQSNQLIRGLAGDEYDLWVRPLEMFLEEVEVAGKKMPRFRYLGVND